MPESLNARVRAGDWLLGVLLRGLLRERVVVVLFVLALVGLFVGHLLHLMLSLSPAH